MIEIRVLRAGSMHIQTARKRFDDNGVDTLALASGTVPLGTVDSLGDRTDRVFNAHDAGGVFGNCRQRNRRYWEGFTDEQCHFTLLKDGRSLTFLTLSVLRNCGAGRQMREVA